MLADGFASREQCSWPSLEKEAFNNSNEYGTIIFTGSFDDKEKFEGFSRIIAGNRGIKNAIHKDYRGISGGWFPDYNIEDSPKLTWETQPVPEKIGKQITFAFAIQTSKIKKTPFMGKFYLNNIYLIDFNVPQMQDMVFTNKDTTLEYKQKSIEDRSSCIFYLTVPSNMVVPGKAMRICLRLPYTNRNFQVILKDYTDVLLLENFYNKDQK